MTVEDADHCPVVRCVAVVSYRRQFQEIFRGVEIHEHLSRGIVRTKNLRGDLEESVSRVEFFDLHAVPIEEVSDGRQAAAGIDGMKRLKSVGRRRDDDVVSVCL